MNLQVGKSKLKHTKNCPMMLALMPEDDSEDEENGQKELYSQLIHAHNAHTDSIISGDEAYITHFCNGCTSNVPIVCTSYTLDPGHRPCTSCFKTDWISSERFLCDYCIENTCYPINNPIWTSRIKTISDYYFNKKSDKQY